MDFTATATESSNLPPLPSEHLHGECRYELFPSALDGAPVYCGRGAFHLRGKSRLPLCDRHTMWFDRWVAEEVA
jgi:hypothetical protein